MMAKSHRNRRRPRVLILATAGTAIVWSSSTVRSGVRSVRSSQLRLSQEQCLVDRCFVGDLSAPGFLETLEGYAKDIELSALRFVEPLRSLLPFAAGLGLGLCAMWALDMSEAACLAQGKEHVFPEIPMVEDAHPDASPDPLMEWFTDDSSGHLDIVKSDEPWGSNALGYLPCIPESDAEGSPGISFHDDAVVAGRRDSRSNRRCRRGRMVRKRHL